VLALGGVAIASPAHAADLGTASSESELADLIDAANTAAGGDTITLTGPGFALTADLPAITDTLTIVGPGSAHFILDAAHHNAFTISGPLTFTMSGLTITDAGVNSGVGAVTSANATTILDDIAVTDSYVGFLGLSGTMTVTDSSASGSGYGAVLILDGPGSRLEHVALNGNDTGMLAILGDSGVLDLVDVHADDNTYEGVDIEMSESAALTSTRLSASRNGVTCGCEGAYITLADDATATFTTTTASGNGDEGIGVYLDNRSSATFTDTIANDNGDDGVEAEAYKHASLTFTRTTANDDDGDGMDVAAFTGASITITGLTASRSGDSGLEITSRGDGSLVTATGVTSSTSGQDGVGIVVVHGGSAALTDSTVSGSTDRGITVDNDAEDSTGSTLTIARTTVRGNGDGSTNGGGIAIVQTHNLVTTIQDSTFSGNHGRQGGGVYTRYATDAATSITIVNSTISGNTGEVGGGAYLRSNAGAQVAIRNSTIAGNTTTGDDPSTAAVYLQGTTNTIRNSIIGGNAALDLDVQQGTALTIDYSLVQAPGLGANTSVLAGTGNVTGVDPLLGPLADNGGSTQTRMPQSNSPAVDAGDPAFTGLNADQRGRDRVIDRLDMGAVEVQPELAATGTADAAPLAALALLLLGLGGAILITRRHATRRPCETPS
jgi:hypothetical protein